MFEHRQSEARIVAKPKTAKPAVITFGPDRIVQAICFHVREDCSTANVLAASVHHTRDRLRRNRVHIVIARRQWEAMSNRERLDWLLWRSKTQMMYSGGTVNLMAQK